MIPAPAAGGTMDRVRADVRALLGDYDALVARLATADRATDPHGWLTLRDEQWAYIEGLSKVESALALQDQYELAAEVAQRLLDAVPTLPGVREGLAAYRAAVDMERRWCAVADVWPDAASTGRLSRQTIGVFWRSYHAFDRVPYWDGSPLHGRTLLLRHWLGYGDWLLRARHIRTLVEEYGARVVVEVEQPLARLARTMPYVADVVARQWLDDGTLDDRRGLATVDFDVWCSNLDLPVLLGSRPDDPTDVPYLAVEPGLIARWGRRLGERDGRLRAGVVWAADVSHAWGVTRSMALAQLAPLATVPGVRWFSLQKTGSIRRAYERPADGGPEAEPPPAGMGLTRLGPELGDFADTGAALTALDLLVTVDTSVANLAGGLGLPLWVLLPTGAPAAVWGADAVHCATYPTARLFRQHRQGAWASVIERVADELTALVAERGAA